MDEIPDVVFSFSLDGSISSKGSLREAVCETTATGVKWTLSGYLAKAVNAAIMAERERCAALLQREADDSLGQPAYSIFAEAAAMIRKGPTP